MTGKKLKHKEESESEKEEEEEEESESRSDSEEHEEEVVKEKVITVNRDEISDRTSYLMSNERGDTVTEIPIQEFIPGIQPVVNLFTTISIYGKRRSGKSVFIKWFCQAFRHEFPWCYIFTLTQLNSFYSSWMPQKYIIPEFNADMMQRVMHRQSEARKLVEKNPKFNPRLLTIFDDYNGKNIKFNTQLENFYYTGRHYMTMTLFAAQHITLTPPAIRSNTELVILFNTDYADSLEHYWKDFGGKLPKEVFYKIFRETAGQENCFLAIDNAPGTPLDKKFFWGKADLLDEGPEYVFGCKEYWIDNQKQLEDIHKGEYKKKFYLSKILSEHIPINKMPPPSSSQNVFKQKQTLLEDENGEDDIKPLEAIEPPEIPLTFEMSKKKRGKKSQEAFKVVKKEISKTKNPSASFNYDLQQLSQKISSSSLRQNNI